MDAIARLLLACACAGLASLAQAQVYKWVDERGVTHYGQRPPAGNQPARQMPSAPPPAPAPASASVAPAAAPAPQSRLPGAQKNDNAAAFASCRSRACTSVRRVDPECKTSLCTEALALPDECSTISCQGRRSELDKQVAAQQKSAAAKAQRASAARSPGEDLLAKKRAEGEAQAKARAVAECKANRGVSCDDPKVAERWAKQNQQLSEAERRQIQAASRTRELCSRAPQALGCP